MVEIRAGESNRGSDGDGVSTAAVGDDFSDELCDGVIPLVGSAVWCWLSTLFYLCL